MKTMLFVDDHPIYRDGLQRTLSEALPDLRIVTAATRDAALALLAKDSDVDFCLSDYRLTDGDGASLLEEVRRRYPDIAIGLLSADLPTDIAAGIKTIGAVACLSKDRDTDALAAAIDIIFKGGTVFDDAPLPPSFFRSLSIRRREILMLAGKGRSDRQIGDQLHISESTVRNHWLYIFERLKAGNRTEAVAKAIRLGLI